MIFINRPPVFRIIRNYRSPIRYKQHGFKTISIIQNSFRNKNRISEIEIQEMLQSRRTIEIKNPQRSSNLDATKFEFTIGSYNILAQYQMINNWYLYTHCQHENLEWNIRWTNLKNDLKALNCDIYCLQEVQGDHYVKEIEPEMKRLGYTGYYSAKTGHKQDGCAILLKDSIFKFLQTPNDTCDDKQLTINFNKPDLNVLRTDNVGQIAIISPVQYPNQEICIANTHLFFNPNSGEVKVAELCLLFAHLDRLARLDKCADNDLNHQNTQVPSYKPIIMCGDFNAEPKSKLLDFIINGSFDISNVLSSEVSGQNETSFLAGRDLQKTLCGLELPPRVGITDELKWKDQSTEKSCVGSGVLSHQFELHSVYQYSTQDKPRLVTSFTCADTCAVDYIFYNAPPVSDSSKTPMSSLELQSCLELFTSEDFFKFGGIPNKHHGSDHIPLVASFRLNFTE